MPTPKNPYSRLTKHELLLRLEDAEDTLRAIRSGEVDALVVSGMHGDQIYTLKDASLPYQIYIQEMNEGALTLNLQGMILYCNPRFAEILGYPLESILGEDFIHFVKPADQERAKLLIKQRPQGLSRGEVTLAGAQGDVQVSLSLREFMQDSMLRLGVVISDITEREQAEEELRLQTTALKAAVSGIVITDNAGNILWINPAFTHITGYTLEDIAHQNLRFLKSGLHDEAFYKDLWDTILSGKVWFGEMINRSKDGRLYVEEQSITPVLDDDGKINNFIAIKKDITERRMAEEALEKSEMRYRSLVNASTQIIWTTNAEGEVVGDLPSWRAFTGQKPEEILGLGLLDAVHPEDRQWATSVWAHAVETRAFFDAEYRVRRSDGNYRNMVARGVPVLDKDQHVREWVGTLQDITEQIEADRKLRQAGVYNRNLLEASLDPLVTITPEGKIGDVNQATELVTGCQREELIGTDFSEYYTEPEKARAVYREVFEKGSVRDYALDIRSKDGTITPVIYNASLYRDESGEVIGVFAAARDIKERKIAESKLEQTNRELLALSQLEHKQRQVAETLRLTSLALTQTLDVDTELEILLEHMRRLLPFDSASAALLGGDSCLLARAVQNDVKWDLDDQDRFIHADEPIPLEYQQMLSKPQCVVIANLAAPLAWSPLPGIEQMRSWLGIPLIADGKIFGLCSLAKREAGFYTEEHAHLAEAFVAQASMAVQNAWLFEQVRSGRERLQALSHRLVELQETERRSIARELHDEAGQALASLIIGLRLLEQEAADPDATTTRVKELRRITESVMEELHRLAINLRPASLDHLGLVAALRQYIESTNERQAISIQFEAIGFESGRLSPTFETSLYRIVQEALTNALMHSQATEIAVILDWRGENVIAIIEDNGIGFDPEATQERMGLAGMRERAEMLGGRFTIESEIGAGTTIHVEVPYGNTNSSS